MSGLDGLGWPTDDDQQETGGDCNPRLVLGSSGQEHEQQQCGRTHYAGCACHEKGWEKKWKCPVEMAASAESHLEISRLQLARMVRQRDALANYIDGIAEDADGCGDEILAKQMRRFVRDTISENEQSPSVDAKEKPMP
jgi:hypothetical protein